MVGIETIGPADLNDIIEQNQMERSASGTTIMKFGAEGPEPLCDHISEIFAEAARDPSLEIAREINNAPIQSM